MKRKTIIFAMGLFIIIGSIFFALEYSRLRPYRNAIKAIEIEGIDLTQVSDGVYEGFTNGILVSAKVIVEVEDHKIVAIQLEHNHGRGKAAEVLIDKVLEMQSTNIDFITGATSSSKVILKAIENALTIVLY
ncbi:hypothetical protein CACET_c07070 [Clostridium aceticum]|uniref:Uncharacterized protein n=1 Tax=Clostridium aceticum TaxID=84022 RepID=A0A0D8IH09_9CLOT|nr:FMN-binding protein [Clostridium aceticum]AKL94217.1 hypothetical protein CACET_c07070 [Clostridium aceticum]KJF28446.1 hypothetical protein TZ02_00490 [Clostridium aceticum]